MDPNNPKSNEMERRISMRNSVRMSVGNGGEDNDFDFAAGMIADGFRPATPNGASPGPSLSNAPPNPTSTVIPESSSMSPPKPGPQRPSSITKPPRQRDSFALRHDGGMGPIPERALSRSSNASTSSTTFIHTENPYQGPSGPSHPYQMYPQNVRIARTMSVATSSSVPVSESSYAGPRGPTHPYGMYPQGTGAEVEESSSVPVAAISVGFGVADQYQRRMGPEGEDIADIIGPDGHTEQLPPYTRYPDEVYNRKVRDAEEPAVDTALAVAGAAVASTAMGGAAIAAPIPAETAASAIAGAGGLGLATRNPEFDTADNVGTPRSRHSSRSFSSDMSHHEINVGAVGLSEKGKQMKPWQVWMTRRLWGVIPYWAVCLTIGVLLLMAIILGSVIGTFLSKHKKPSHKDSNASPDSSSTVTVTYDATPIPTPSNLASLAMGTFGLPFSTNAASTTCFNDTTQSQAWDCNIVISGLVITVDKVPNSGSDGDYLVSINCNQSLTMANNVYSYGEQPPLIVDPQVMELVNDTYEPNRGPAWFKMIAFNKTVIIPEAFLSTSSSSTSTKRAYKQFEQLDSFKRKGVAQSGDRPWICTWPETLLEVFIYPNQNSSWYRPPASASSAAAAATATTKSGIVVAGSYEPSSSSSARDAASSSGPFGPIDTGINFMPPPPPYPKVLKLEERRVQHLPAPTCTQVEIGGSGESAKPVRDANGNPITVTIVENEPPPPGTVVSDKARKRTLVFEEDHPDRPLYYRDTSTEMSDCGCMWFLT